MHFPLSLVIQCCRYFTHEVVSGNVFFMCAVRLTLCGALSSTHAVEIMATPFPRQPVTSIAETELVSRTVHRDGKLVALRCISNMHHNIHVVVYDA